MAKAKPSEDREETAKHAIRNAIKGESDERALEILDELASECDLLADGIRDDMKCKEEDDEEGAE